MSKEIKAAIIGGIAALFAALLTIVLPPYLEKEAHPPRYIIPNPFVSSKDDIIIAADNEAANRNEPIHVKFDNVLYPGKGLPDSKENEKQRWRFSLAKCQHTKDMLRDGEHVIRVGFRGDELTDPISVFFNTTAYFMEKKSTAGKGKSSTKTTEQSKTFAKATTVKRDPLLPGRRACTGKVRGLTVLVEFQDERHTIDKNDVDAMLNDENYRANGNCCSVRDYFLKVSNGKLDYSNQVVGPVTLSNDKSYYINKAFMNEALEKVVNELKVDLSRFDSKGEGIVDAINFIYAGRTVYRNWLWPHTSLINIAFGKFKTNFYSLTSVGRKAEDLSIGTFAHNAAQMLCRLPDIYDYGQRDGDFESSAGFGIYDLLSSGSYIKGGKNPAPISACLRDFVGWHEKEVTLNAPGTYEIEHGDYGTIYKYKTKKENEYFVVENRSQLDLDKHIPANGLGIYHCDTAGSNEWQSGTEDRHYKVALLQADGKLDLERNTNTGDNSDLWGETEGIALSKDTNPSSRMWDGSDSGFVVSNIGKPGKTIVFEVGSSQ